MASERVEPNDRQLSLEPFTGQYLMRVQLAQCKYVVPQISVHRPEIEPDTSPSLRMRPLRVKFKISAAYCDKFFNIFFISLILHFLIKLCQNIKSQDLDGQYKYFICKKQSSENSLYIKKIYLVWPLLLNTGLNLSQQLLNNTNFMKQCRVLDRLQINLWA